MSNIRDVSISCGEPALPQQIYEACLKKQAFLFVRDRAGCVLKPFSENGIPAVLIWAAWSERQDGMDEYTDFIKFLARKIGARFIRFYTVRKGFVRAGKKYGWCHVGFDDKERMIFEMKL